MKWSIAHRLGVLAAIAVLATLAVSAVQLGTLRTSIYAERQKALTAQVQAAVSIVSGFAAQAASGKLSEKEAQEQAKAALRSIRYGQDDYIFVHTEAGVTVVHPKRELEGKNRWDEKDGNGVYQVRSLIEAGQKGGGFVAYSIPRASSDVPAPKLSYCMRFAPWGWIVGTGVYIDDLETIFRAEMRSSLLWVAGLVLILIAVVWPLSRGLVMPIKALTAAMTSLAGGDIDTRIPAADRRDEIGLMARAMQHFKDVTVSKLRLEDDAAEQRRVTADKRKEAEAERQHAADEQAHAIGTVGEALRHLAGGDLTIRIATGLASQYEELRADFNASVERLQQAVSTVKDGVDGIRSGTGHIVGASDDLSRRTESQAASLAETAASVEEISTTVNQTAAGAREASEIVATAKVEAQKSTSVVERAIDAMNAIDTSSKAIARIVDVIDAIAFQTNLLALNAGVEAARAGDAGRGFAVVASEVRGLAQRSADSAREIKRLISAAATEVDQGVELVGETGTAIERIVGAVDEINRVVTGIAAGTREQASGLKQINVAVGRMELMTQQNAAMVEEATAATRTLSEQTTKLSEFVSRFRTDAEANRPGSAAVRVHHTRRAGPRAA